MGNKTNFIHAARDAAERAASDHAEKTGQQLDQKTLKRNSLIGVLVGLTAAFLIIYWLGF